MNNRIYLSPPHLAGDERNLLIEAVESNWIAPLGPHVDAFEKEMSKYLGVGCAVALSTGSAALHLSLKIAGIKSGDAVLCPSLTFAASANVILYENAVPVFIDVSSNTWTLDLSVLEIAFNTYKPKALIVVDLYGQSCDYDPIAGLCNQYNVALIEDAAEALGSEYKGKKCGTFGKMGVLSFNGNKIITTSSGGMLVSDDKVLIDRARFLATQAREPVLHYEHKDLGYNYRMSNILAAIGRGQLQVLDEHISARRSIFQRYFNALSNIEGVDFMPEAGYGQSNRWLTTLTVDPKKTGVSRTRIIQALEEENIEARPVWKPMHMQPLYKNCKYITKDRRDISKELFEQGLCLPSGSSLSISDQSRVIEIILTTIQS